MLDIQKIVTDKIQSMEDSGEIQERIEKAAEKLVLNAIDGTLGSYRMRQILSDKIEEMVSKDLHEVDFSAYNGFIAEKIRQITEGVLQEDAAGKVKEVFEGIFVRKYDRISLTDILEHYREYLIHSLDEEEQYDLENQFYMDVNERKGFFADSLWYDVKLAKSESDYKDNDNSIRFSVRYNPGSGIGKIGLIYLDGDSVDGKLKIGYINSFEAMLMSLYYNETPITMDFDAVGHMDTSLGLDF